VLIFNFGNTIPNASAVLIRRSVYEKAGCMMKTYVFVGLDVLWVKCSYLYRALYKPLNYFLCPFEQ